MWAISHPTLVKTDVPVLRAAGIDVVTEEPDPSVLRELDFVQYDVEGESTTDVELGRRLRLWTRDGKISSAEAFEINNSFDAIMVATRLDVAVNVRKWFHGSVLFRFFGNVPALPEASRATSDPTSVADIIGVPIFRGLLDTLQGRAFTQTQLLGTTVPTPKHLDGALSGQRSAIGIYLAGIAQHSEVLCWVTTLAATVAQRQVLAFGVDEALQASYEAAAPNLKCLPRLEEAAYRRIFASILLMVYPHDDPHHSHFIPLEAISMGIPCLLVSQGAVAQESAIPGSADGGANGVFLSRDAMVSELAAITVSGPRLATVASAQHPLLAPFSIGTIRHQAAELRDILERDRAVRNRPSRVVEQKSVSGIPSTAALRSTLRGGLPAAMHQAPSSIAAAAVLGRPWSAALADSGAAESFSHLRLEPGCDLLLKLGAPLGRPNEASHLRVTLDTSGLNKLIAVVEVVNGDDIPQRFLLNHEALCPGDRWSTTVTLTGNNAARIRVMTTLTGPDVTLRDVIVGPGKAGETTPSVVEHLRSGVQLPLWTVAVADRLKVPGTHGRHVSFLKAHLPSGQAVVAGGTTARLRCHAVVLRRSSVGLAWPCLVVAFGRGIRVPLKGRGTVVAVGSATGLRTLALHEIGPSEGLAVDMSPHKVRRNNRDIVQPEDSALL